jgi:hypothetical protein
MEPSAAALGYLVMPDFPIDPELRIRATPPIVLRRTTQALDFIRKLALSGSDVKLELLLEGEGLLIEKETAYASRSDQGRSRAA